MHLASSLIPLGYWLAGREIALMVLGVMICCMLLAEYARLRTTWGRQTYNRFFGSMTRPAEQGTLTGATYVLVGMALASFLFPAKIAITVMLFLSLGDSAAAIVGQRYGRIPIGRKTLEGTLACFVVCSGITLAAGFPWLFSLAAGTVGAITELIPWGVLNDNIAIPLVSGGFMYFMLSVPA